MLGKAASRIAWVGRTASMVLGLAMVFALIVGFGTTALAAVPGDPLRLGKLNAINALTRISGTANNALLRIENEGKGENVTALELKTAPQRPPMRVNSLTKVENLHADLLDGRNASQFANGLGDGTAVEAADSDKLDGLDSTQIGINGYTFVRDESGFDSNTSKRALADCPLGTQIVGGGGDVLVSLNDPNRKAAPIALRTNGVDLNGFDHWDVDAVEVVPYGFEWEAVAMAVCAKVGNP